MIEFIREWAIFIISILLIYNYCQYALIRQLRKTLKRSIDELENASKTIEKLVNRLVGITDKAFEKIPPKGGLQ